MFLNNSFWIFINAKRNPAVIPLQSLCSLKLLVILEIKMSGLILTHVRICFQYSNMFTQIYLHKLKQKKLKHQKLLHSTFISPWVGRRFSFLHIYSHFPLFVHLEDSCRDKIWCQHLVLVLGLCNMDRTLVSSPGWQVLLYPRLCTSLGKSVMCADH